MTLKVTVGMKKGLNSTVIGPILAKKGDFFGKNSTPNSPLSCGVSKNAELKDI